MKNKFGVQEDSDKRKREDDWPSRGLGVCITENPMQYERPQQAEDDKEVIIDKELCRTLRVGKGMDLRIREVIIQVFTEYKDVFACEASKMLELDSKVMSYELNIKEGFTPIM